MQDVIAYSFSKIKIIGGFVLLTLLVLLFLFLLGFSLLWDIHFGMVIGIFFFFLLLLAWFDQYKALRKCLQGLPALQLTPQALIDNTNNISFAWKDILAFKDVSVNMGRGSRKSSIGISLCNEAEYLRLVNGWKKRLIARLNSRFFGGAFSIETNAIKESRLIVLNSLNDFKNKYSS